MKTKDVRVEQRVIEKTAELIAQKGIKGWNMDKLADAAGLAKNTLYKMIGSKEKLLTKVTLGFISDVQLQLNEVLTSDSDYLARFDSAVALFPKLIDKLYAEYMGELFLEYPSIETSVLAHRDAMTDAIIQFIQKGIDCGTLSKNLSPTLVFETMQAIVLYHMKKNASSADKSTSISKSIAYLTQGLISHDK